MFQGKGNIRTFDHQKRMPSTHCKINYALTRVGPELGLLIQSFFF